MARALADTLVREKLVACVNLIPAVQSLFWWQGRVDEANEWLIMAKTRAALFPAVENRLRALHPYDVPEIIALPIMAGSGDYLAWLNKATDPETAV